MRICVDARVVKKYPGLGRYCVNILDALTALDRQNEYVVLTLAPERFDFLAGRANVKVVPVDVPVLSLGSLYRYSRVVNRLAPDLFLAAFQVAPLRVRAPMVLVLHDMMDLLYKDAFSHHPWPVRIGLRAFFRYAIPRTVARATEIVTDSESTRTDLLGHFDRDPATVTTVLLGVEKRFAPVTDPGVLQEVRSRHRLPSRFVLYLGSIKPYKNLDGTLAAFAALVRSGGPADVQLVIGGLRHFNLPRLKARIGELGIDDRVVHVGYVPEEDLPAVYSLAEVFLFPSIWEGFGFPALEAMACGTPVLAGDASSLPEVVGGAGILVDPHDPGAIAAGLRRLLGDPGLRRRLADAGRERAGTFTWQEAAERTLTVFRRAAAKEQR